MNRAEIILKVMLVLMLFLITSLPLEVLWVLSMEALRNIFHGLRYDEFSAFRSIFQSMGVERSITGNAILSLGVGFCGTVAAINLIPLLLVTYLTLDLFQFTIGRMWYVGKMISFTTSPLLSAGLNILFKFQLGTWNVS